MLNITSMIILRLFVVTCEVETKSFFKELLKMYYYWQCFLKIGNN